MMASELPIAGSGACPEGGHIGLNGTFSTDTSGAVFALTDTLVACGIKDNHSNVWTFTSKPTLSVTIELPNNIQGGFDRRRAFLTSTIRRRIGCLFRGCRVRFLCRGSRNEIRRRAGIPDGGLDDIVAFYHRHPVRPIGNDGHGNDDLHATALSAGADRIVPLPPR